MSRVTRAASRAAKADLHDQENLGSSINQKRDPIATIAHRDRPILGEIGANEIPHPTSESVERNKQKAMGKPGANKGRGKKGALPFECADFQNTSDNVERHIESDTQTEPPSVPRNNGPTSEHDETLAPGDEATQGQGNNRSNSDAVPAPHMATVDLSTLIPPPSATPQSSRINSSFKAMTEKTPKFKPTMHERSSASSIRAMENGGDDSFEQEIHSRTPARSAYQDSENPHSNVDSEPDSFVNDIKTRSPAKSVTAVADSIDALDALEDEIERVTEGLPNLKDEALKSPLSPDFTSKRPSSLNPGKTRPAPSLNTNRSRKPTRPMSTSSPPKAHRGFSPTKSRLSSVANYPDRRTSISTRKPAFVPSKSNKVPTRPTFTLPGEAVSARQKAQRDERTRHEEEALRQRREFKARPVRLSGVLPARENAASRARASLAKQPTIDGGQERTKENARPGQKAAASADRPSPAVPPTKSFTIRPPRPSSSAVTTTNRHSNHTKPARSSSTSTSTTTSFSLPGTNGNAPLPPKARAKGMLNRDKAESQNRVQERKEKEEAAKKARAEAAERGRIASREWVEKQKKKKEMAVGKLNGVAAGKP